MQTTNTPTSTDLRRELAELEAKAPGDYVPPEVAFEPPPRQGFEDDFEYNTRVDRLGRGFAVDLREQRQWGRERHEKLKGEHRRNVLALRKRIEEAEQVERWFAENRDDFAIVAQCAAPDVLGPLHEEWKGIEADAALVDEQVAKLQDALERTSEALAKHRASEPADPATASSSARADLVVAGRLADATKERAAWVERESLLLADLEALSTAGGELTRQQDSAFAHRRHVLREKCMGLLAMTTGAYVENHTLALAMLLVFLRACWLASKKQGWTVPLRRGAEDVGFVRINNTHVTISIELGSQMSPPVAEIVERMLQVGPGVTP